MIGISYIVRGLVALVVAWWLGVQLNDAYLAMAEKLAEVREGVNQGRISEGRR